jgi:hypothetical protein
MAFEIVRTKSINVTATFASKQYTFVTLDTNGQLATPSAGADAIGVIQDNPASGPGAVCSPGDITKVKCGGSFDAGDYVTTDGSGLAVEATSGDHILGQALAAGALNAIATILFQSGSAIL